MKKEEMANKLLKIVNETDIITALYSVFGVSVSVSVPFSKKSCETGVEALDFSVRASNAMKRVGIFTIGQVIDMVADDGLLRIRNLGKKTQNEIKTRILAFGYDNMSEKDKLRFLVDTIERNCEE